jgi:hypothetical protein
MLLMHNIDFTLANQNGLKAKNATESRKILDIIAWYEANMSKTEQENERVPDVAVIQEIPEDGEDGEEEEPADSSYTASPNLYDGLGGQP